MKTLRYFWIIMVAAFALPTMAQNYEAQQPNSAFQSTSTMMGSGSSLSSNPTINENGTASAPASAPAKAPGMRKSLGLPDAPNIEGVQGNTPIGDAVLPLLLMAAAFAGVTYLRRRKSLNAEN